MHSHRDMISTMDTLPDPVSQPSAIPAQRDPASRDTHQPSAGNTGQTQVGSVGKEIDGGIGIGEEGLRDVSGVEVELPKEVASAGVKVHPTTVAIPQPVQQLGVKPTGANVPAQTTTVALPLTDDQIATGVKASITTSLRWLAEWCVRRIKQLHGKLKRTGAQ